MPFGQIDNPHGAFSGLTTVNTPDALAQFQPTIRRFRNLSTGVRVKPGVVLVRGVNSTAAGYGTTLVSALGTSVAGAVFRTTVIGHPGAVGIALTSCADRSSNADPDGIPATSETCLVITEGPAWATLSTVSAPAAGDHLVVGSATLSGSTGDGYAFGGTLEPLSTALTSAAGVAAVISVVGQCIVAGATGSTGQLHTSVSKGLIWVRPSVCFRPHMTTA